MKILTWMIILVIIFPKGFEVRDLENLRHEFEKLANRYGLTFLQNLRRETLY